jgi:segregation and condensation protein A
MSIFEIKIDAFEGPLELLLELIQKRKLFINDISLSEVADEYIEIARARESFPTDDAATFIVIASTLLLIKSKSLLPELNLTQEEEEDVGELEHRLHLYKIFSDYAEELGKQFGITLLFPQQERKEVIFFRPHESIDTNSLGTALSEVIERFPKKEMLKRATVQKVIRLEEVIQDLARRIQNELSIHFNTVAGKGIKEKKEIIVTFLAVLELVKQGMVFVEQENAFGDMQIESREVATPNYS